MFAKKELVGMGGERGLSESSYIGGGMAAFEPRGGRPSSSWENEEEPKQVIKQILLLKSRFVKFNIP